MTPQELAKICEGKQNQLLDKYFGNLVHEAAIERPETIGKYTKDLPLKIEAEYRIYLEKLWKLILPEDMKDLPLVLDEQRLRKLMTDDDREMIDYSYKNAIERTLWERIIQTNHEDVTYYKGLLKEYTYELLLVMRHDFMEEIIDKIIRNKAFPDIEICTKVFCPPAECEQCVGYRTLLCRYYGPENKNA